MVQMNGSIMTNISCSNSCFKWVISYRRMQDKVVFFVNTVCFKSPLYIVLYGMLRKLLFCEKNARNRWYGRKIAQFLVHAHSTGQSANCSDDLLQTNEPIIVSWPFSVHRDSITCNDNDDRP